MVERSSAVADVHDELTLVTRIRKSESSTETVSTTLKTDERVIARVTDGIYRQPGSSLRELISNAYDADAKRVVIKTDAPRFERMTIEDDGHGMTPETLAHLLFHIGGSAKRNDLGKGLGITAPDDSLRSPGGRKLIGKIGIGLFSVSQLTYSFQIITKVEGESYRTIATVALKQYSDEEPSTEQGENKKYESGKVNIWREKAADISSHGTTVVLTNIRPQARDTLRSREIWSTIERIEDEAHEGSEEREAIKPPKFHIGRVDSPDYLLRKTDGKFSTVPWDKLDSPDKAFRKLVQCVWDEVFQGDPNPKLDQIFDYYLRMVWQISLAVPLPYVDGHIFDMNPVGWADAFKLSNRPKGSAQQIRPREGESIRQALGLTDPEPSGEFEVLFDDLKLQRPIKFRDLPMTNHALREPLVFLGQCREEFPKVPRELSGGPLDFEAYLFWTPKVAPTEHQGSLIRINGSSGTLFDPTFMRYQVSEQTRLRQITCEIFVNEGLDSALNIDRESFNNAHPHSVYIMRWLHEALRQLATVQKRRGAEAREQNRDESKGQTVSKIQQVALDVWTQETDDPSSRPPAIEISGSRHKTGAGEAYVFDRLVVIPKQTKARTAKMRATEAILDEKLKAIAQVLASFGLLDAIPQRKQENLLKAIYKIIDMSEE